MTEPNETVIEIVSDTTLCAVCSDPIVKQSIKFSTHASEYCALFPHAPIDNRQFICKRCYNTWWWNKKKGLVPASARDDDALVDTLPADFTLEEAINYDSVFLQKLHTLEDTLLALIDMCDKREQDESTKLEASGLFDDMCE